MADQKRWFKLWCSAPSDDDLLALEPAIRWAWAALGCYTKEHGTNGAVRISRTNSVLAAQMGTATAELFSTIARLPHLYLSNAPIRWPHGHDKEQVCEGQFIRGGDPLNGRGSSMLEEWCARNGYVIVTWKNWNKYQEDSTARDRVYALRSKRRGEERRGEEKRGEEKKKRSTPPHAPPQISSNGFRVPVVILDALRRAPRLGIVTAEKFWQAELRANPGVDYPAEILKAEAWLTAHPEKHYKKLSAFLHGWLGRSDREELPT